MKSDPEVKPDTTKLDQLAEKHLDAVARLDSLCKQTAAARTASDVAFAQFHGAAAELAALHGGRAKAIGLAAVERVKARLASLAGGGTFKP